MKAENPIQIDENLYSRQLYVIGVDAMKKLVQSSVLISGLGGLGVEIAKNVILAGTKNVTIQDTEVATRADLASQFYLTEESLGQNRAMASLQQLTSLNEYVSVNATSEPLTDSLISKFNLVVITEYHPLSEIKHIAEFCRSHNIKFILTQISGVFGFIFDDFGSDFISSDALGNEPSRFQLGMVTRNTKGVVTLSEGETMDLQDGDFVRFEEVEGMTELNKGEYPVTVIRRNQFSIGDTSNFHEYTQFHTNGVGIQVIKPTPFHFKSLEDALRDPERIVLFNEMSFGRDQQVVLAFFAGMASSSASEISANAAALNSEYHLVDEIDTSLLSEFTRTWRLSISPMAAIFGGIAGQEVIKALGAKFTPIMQFLATGLLESVPSFGTYSTESSTDELSHVPKNDRYDPYRKIFGDSLFDKISSSSYFLVGAGALGCEMMKNWALMGVGTKGGKIYCTDHDSIEKSNLNRQFLFRKGDIGHSKSASAAAAAHRMNPDFSVIAHQNFVGEDTRNIYNDAFFQSLSGICNALDNVKARRFMDSMSALYTKPLLESGTLGTSASFQIVIPRLTEQYSDTADPENLPGVALCTLTNSPSTIPHCCEWAKVQFEKQFVTIPETLNKFFAPGANLASFNEMQVRFVKKVCEDNPHTWEDCLAYGRQLYNSFFVGKIRKLTEMFPEDAKNSDGTNYWSRDKRFPHQIPFDPSNQRSRAFVLAAASIRARICGITPGEYKDVPAKPKGTVLPRGMSQEEVVKTARELYERFPEWHDGKRILTPESFEKDSEVNMHMEFMEGAVNNRAENYSIKPATKLEIKKIVGNIIPAIATTTAMVTGFVCMEMYKVHSLRPRKINDFRSGFINLGPMTTQFWPPYPALPKKICSANGMEFDQSTVWSVEGDLTVKEFLEKCKEKYSLDVTGIVIGSGMVYMNFPPYDATINRKIVEYAVEKKMIPPVEDGTDSIMVTITLDDEEVELPMFMLKFR